MLKVFKVYVYHALGEEQEGSRAGGQGEDAVPRLKLYR
jgi:hypothetical protein